MKHFLLTILGFAVISGTVAGIELFIEYGAGHRPELASVLAVFLMLLFLCIAVAVHYRDWDKRTKGLETRLDDLLAIAPRFTYYEADQGRDLLFEECRRIVHLAQTDIMALNWFREEREEPVPARSAYFAERMERSKTVRYRRVIQAASNHDLRELFHPSYIEHFSAMIAERESRPSSGQVVELSKSPPRVPSTFLIVDGSHLVWELVELLDPQNPDTSKWKMRGIIVVHDRTFVKHFEQTWESIHAKSSAVSASDLARPS